MNRLPEHRQEECLCYCWDVCDLDELFNALAKSTFRRRFALRGKDAIYFSERGIDAVCAHAQKIVGERLAPAEPRNDGKQTPMRGHPVFVAQHATGTCCRSCLLKWHKIPKGHELTNDERDYIIDVIRHWLQTQAPKQAPPKHPPQSGLFD